MPHLVPVFWEIANGKSPPQGFAMNAFAKAATLNEMLVYRITRDNLCCMAEKATGSKSFLFGYVCSAKALENATWPNKKKATAVCKKWRDDLEYDCIEFVPNNGLRRLVVFSPFLIYATHLLGPLSKNDIMQLGAQIDVPGAVQNLSAQTTTFAPPAGGAKLLVSGKQREMISTRGEAESGGEVAPVESGQTDDEKEEFVKVSLLHGTWLKEHSFPLIWEGDELELPSEKRKTQRDLLQKNYLF